MDLIRLYEDILKSIGMNVDRVSGNISMNINDKPMPCMVKKMELVLPTAEALKVTDWSTKVAFHPLSENVLRGESPVLGKLRALMNYRLSEVINVLMVELMAIAADTDMHEKLSPEQGRFLDSVKFADEKTLKALSRILENTSPTSATSVVSIYLKRGGKWRGEKYSRVAVTSFPIIDEFVGDGQTIFGVKMPRKKDKTSIEGLFNYIVPHSDDLEAYSYGTHSMTAPYFDSLCHAYATIAKQLNKVTRLFSKHLNTKHLHIDVKWLKEMDDLSKYIDLIPPLEGNEGSFGKDKQTADANAKQPLQSMTPTPTPPIRSAIAPASAPALAAPAPQTAPVATAPETQGQRKLSWSEVTANMARAQAPVHAPAFPLQGGVQPPFNPPYHNVPQPAPAPQTARGRIQQQQSMMRAYPAYQQQPMAQTTQMPPMGYAQAPVAAQQGSVYPTAI